MAHGSQWVTQYTNLQLSVMVFFFFLSFPCMHCKGTHAWELNHMEHLVGDDCRCVNTGELLLKSPQMSTSLLYSLHYPLQSSLYWSPVLSPSLGLSSSFCWSLVYIMSVLCCSLPVQENTLKERWAKQDDSYFASHPGPPCLIWCEDSIV